MYRLDTYAHTHLPRETENDAHQQKTPPRIFGRPKIGLKLGRDGDCCARAPLSNIDACPGAMVLNDHIRVMNGDMYPPGICP